MSLLPPVPNPGPASRRGLPVPLAVGTSGAVLCLVTQSCPTLSDPMDCSPLGSSVHGVSPGKNTRVGCHALLQGIFQSQGSNPGLPHCRWFLYHLSHQGSPPILCGHSKTPKDTDSALQLGKYIQGSLHPEMLLSFPF